MISRRGVSAMPEAISAVRPKCGAHKRDGSFQDCGQPAGWGTDHPGVGRCKYHGGCTPSHSAHARRLSASTEARS